MKRKFKWSNLYLIFVFICLYVPIFYLVIYSFSTGDRMSNYSGFTWKHYAELFADTRMIQIVLDTLLVALLSSLIATIIGALGALVVLMILPRLQEMSHSMLDAARDLGASNYQVLTRVIVPYITPGIFSGFFMAFTYSLDDFAVTFFVTGNGFETLAVEIYARARQGISLEINALSGVMFVFALLLVVGYYFIQQAGQSRRAKHKRESEALLNETTH